jgi:autotransporter family porin
LLGTALASTLFIATTMAPTPAHAVFDCLVGPPPAPASPGPISATGIVDSIVCVNTEPRTNNAGSAIFLTTLAVGAYSIYLNNSGALTAIDGGFTRGIFTYTGSGSSPVSIVNSGDIIVNAITNLTSDGIFASVRGSNGGIDIVNSGDVTIDGQAVSGILAYTDNDNNPFRIVNSGDIWATGTLEAFGIRGVQYYSDDSSPISIANSGDIWATAGGFAFGIQANTNGVNSPISIMNSGKIAASGDVSYGIRVISRGDGSPIIVTNGGDIWSTSNSGSAGGISARTIETNSAISLANSGNATVTSLLFSIGLYGRTNGATNSPVTILNSGNLHVSSTNYAWGIFGETRGTDSPLLIQNTGDVTMRGISDYTQSGALVGDSFGSNSPVTIMNNGSAMGLFQAHGIFGRTVQADSPLTIINTGNVMTQGTGAAIYSRADLGAPTIIQNSGSVFGDLVGIRSVSPGTTTIVNSGDISAQSLLAIQSFGPGDADIFNAGTITGYVQLDADDTFINQAGGVFEARQTSDFDYTGLGGTDIFINQRGGLVHTANYAPTAETTRFVNLETFQNRGTISLVDQGTGDQFIISNTPGGTNLNFIASGDSTLAVDAVLGGPSNSSADTFTIEGNVSGVTTVQVNNLNTFGPGVFNPKGIPVVFVTGATPSANAFQLDQPIDTGFFDYDLFFTPTGSGFWSLKSFPGGGAFLLPQLITAAQDIWHEGSSTWFDRTADLRVLLNGGAAPGAYGANGAYGPAPNGAPPGSFTPAVWARGSGSWLERDDTERATAYGRSYQFNLDRDLTTVDFQVGLDLGRRDLMSPGDILVFGFLGGFVHGSLDYDDIAREFDFSGGQVGAYATYLRGGLFVDTLFNAHIYELDPNGTLGFPDSLDANTIGLRTDTGYRFGSFSGGPFWEPLATIEVTWADINGFSLGGNTVSFDDDPNVRGRLGVRAGTSRPVWEGTIMEPFVIGSLWGNLTDDNQATLVSTGRTFQFQDDLQDVWGEVSAGVNFFNLTQTTAVFAKADVTFGDDITGVGGKAGMRVNW